MADKARALRYLSNNISVELDFVLLYSRLLLGVTDDAARKVLKKLIKESLHHKDLFTKEIFRIQESLIKSDDLQSDDLLEFLELGRREEIGAKSIYKYQAKHVKDKHTKKLLLKIAEEESKHEYLLKSVEKSLKKK